jgi:hypothetical protein
MVQEAELVCDVEPENLPASQLVQTEAPAAEYLPAATQLVWAFVTALLSKKLTHRAKSASGAVWPLLRVRPRQKLPMWGRAPQGSASAPPEDSESDYGSDTADSTSESEAEACGTRCDSDDSEG